MPARHLETFGATILNYHLVSELMDNVNQVRVREGRMQALRPSIVTPEMYSQTLLEGFGEEAQKYVDWLKQHESEIRILQYGYRLKQESFSETVVTDNLKAVVERVQQQAVARNDPLDAIVVGVDDPWDVCLVKLFWEVIQKSARVNFEQIDRRGLFERVHGIPRAIREEIETAFLDASRNPNQIKALGARLQQYGVFEEYQDRFFSLVKASK